MLLEIESLLARAETNRYLLIQLLEQVPGDSWMRRASGEAWPAQQHLAHLATIDAVTLDLITVPRDHTYRLDLELQRQRVSAMEAVVEQPPATLIDALASSRTTLVVAIGMLDEPALALPVMVDVPGGWPPIRQLSLRAYLAGWAEHDAEHTAAIRAAIASPPSAGDLALAARLNRRR